MTAHYNGEATNVLKQRIMDELRPVIEDLIESRLRETQDEHPTHVEVQGDINTNNNQEPLF